MKSPLRSVTVAGANVMLLAASPQVADSATRLITTIIAMIASTGTSVDRPAVTIETIQDAAVVVGAIGGWLSVLFGRSRASATLRWARR